MRKLLLILAGLVVVVLIGVVILISQIDVSEYQEQALAQVEKATGRKVSIDGDLDLSISLTPAIVVEGVRFANAEWGSRPDMVTIKRIEVKVALLPLISGEVEVQRFILIEPDVLLEKNAAGKGNWEIGTADSTDSGETSNKEMTTIDIGTVLVNKLKLVYRDAASEKPVEFSIDTLKLDSIDGDLLKLELKAALDENSINVDGTIGSLQQLFDNNEYPIDINADFGPAKATLKGIVKKPLLGKGLNLAASLNVAHLDELNSLTGGQLPAVGPLSITTQISDADGKYVLSDYKLSLADTVMQGEITADLSAKVPNIKAKLQSPLVDLVPFQPEPPAEEEKVERYLSDEILPLEGLKSVNANIAIKINEVRTRQATINDFDTTLIMDRGNLQIKPLSMKLASGSINGSVNVNASQKTAGVSVELDGKNIHLGQLDQLKDKLSGGATQITIRLKGNGNSSQAIAGGADGKLLVQIGTAAIKRDEKKDGLLASLGRLLNPFSEKDNANLNCAALNFAIKDGIATANKGIGLETDQITVSGGGEINLKNEKLALGFEPHAKGVIAGTITNLASGMSAGGTLANPKVKINPAGVAMGAIKSVAGGAGSIVGSLFGKKDASTTDTAPCQTALTGKSTPAKAPAKIKQSAETPTEKKSVAEKALDAPKKLLKSLFD